MAAFNLGYKAIMHAESVEWLTGALKCNKDIITLLITPLSYLL